MTFFTPGISGRRASAASCPWVMRAATSTVIADAAPAVTMAAGMPSEAAILVPTFLWSSGVETKVRDAGHRPNHLFGRDRAAQDRVCPHAVDHRSEFQTIVDRLAHGDSPDGRFVPEIPSLFHDTVPELMIKPAARILDRS